MIDLYQNFNINTWASSVDSGPEYIWPAIVLAFVRYSAPLPYVNLSCPILFCSRTHLISVLDGCRHSRINKNIFQMSAAGWGHFSTATSVGQKWLGQLSCRCLSLWLQMHFPLRMPNIFKGPPSEGVWGHLSNDDRPEKHMDWSQTLSAEGIL